MKAPPHNIEAEQGLLGALLYDNRLMPLLEGRVRGLHFFDPIHGLIFDRIAELIRDGRAVDPLTLKEWWLQQPAAADLGGSQYLLTLIDRAARFREIAFDYAATIVHLSQRRALIEAADELRASALSADCQPMALAAQTEAALRGIDIGGASEGVTATEAARSFLEGLDRPVISTGYASLDERLGGWARSDLIILAGRPSMGKTALAAEFARRAAHRGVAHFASMEMSREQLARRCISAQSFHAERAGAIEYFKLRNGARGIDRARLSALAETLPSSLIIDDAPSQSLDRLEGSARETRRRLGRIDLIVVDYLQLMRSRRTDGRVNEIGDISQGLKAIAKRLNCPVIALSQLSRGVESRENKRPALNDLRDSGAIEQDADVVLGAYREAYYLERSEPDKSAASVDWFEWHGKLERVKRRLEVITLKQRQGPIGTDALEAWLEFDAIVEARA